MCWFMLVHNDQPTTICFLNTHGIRYTVQLCQHDLIKAALVDGRNSMFVGTYITLCYTTLNYIKLHYLKLHYIQTCVNIFANMRTYTVIYIYMQALQILAIKLSFVFWRNHMCRAYINYSNSRTDKHKILLTP